MLKDEDRQNGRHDDVSHHHPAERQDGGRFIVPLSAENRAAAGAAAGDEVEVELTMDTKPREVGPPADFAAALDAEPAAKGFFATMNYSDKR